MDDDFASELIEASGSQNTEVKLDAIEISVRLIDSWFAESVRAPMGSAVATDGIR